MQVFAIVFIFIFFNACTSHKSENLQSHTKKDVVKQQIEDLKIIPQNPSYYTKGIDKKAFDSLEFEKNYFRVWNIKTPSVGLEDAKWSYRAFTYGNSYGENLQLIDETFFNEMYENSNFENYSSLNKRALSLGLLNIRAFPTDKPLFRDPKKAGEGFPFDYLQNSTVAPNKPLFVSHYSKDREWVFVESSFAFGWVKRNQIAFIEKKYTDIWQKAEQVFLTKDGVALFSEDNNFLFSSRVGMMLALIEENTKSYTVLTVRSDGASQAYYTKTKVLKSDAHRGALDFNAKNIDKITLELLKTNYGWGGMYGQRDCSSTLRDFYAPFALWLPRNSLRQAQVGEVLSLKNLSDDEKIEYIKNNATPFETLLYKRGHIVLYVGTLNEQVVVLQNVWGVKTATDGVEGRNIVGKTIFSTLELGKNLHNYDENSSMLRSLESMNSLRD